jgi:hypothetical protein
MPEIFRRATARAPDAVEPPLPVEYWCQQSPIFTFGVPLGWRSFSSDQLGELSGRNGAKVLAGVYIEQTSTPTTDVIVSTGISDITSNQFLQRIPELAAQRAQAVARQVVGTPRTILIGSKPALLIEMQGVESGHEWRESAVPGGYTEVFALSSNRVFLIAMAGRLDHHSEYLPGFYTMLGTWRWS